jgi:hypothetical protein
LEIDASDFESKLADRQRQIEALTMGLQKVNAQLEASKPTPQMVVNRKIKSKSQRTQMQPGAARFTYYFK